MNAYQIELETRRQGAIGSWSTRRFVVQARDETEASQRAISHAHRQNYETRFPVSVSKVKVRAGTHHFISEMAAERYYQGYGFTHHDVRTKIESGEIAIGEPTLKAGETLGIDTVEGRYWIES